MKYLRKFATEAEAEALGMPNVVLFADTKAVAYNYIPHGVYIHHIDGGLYSEEDWSANGFSNDLANGVAVVDANCRIVLAKEDCAKQWESSAAWSSNSTELLAGVFTTENTAEAMKDYAGKANSDVIVKNSTSGAAIVCNNYIFPNGTNGYLPSSGELYSLYLKKAKIQSALTLIGASFSTSQPFRSSTQYNATRAWGLSFVTGIAAINKSEKSPFVRAVMSL